MRKRLAALVLGLSVSGCAAMQDYHYCLVQKYRADSAWSQHHGMLNMSQGKDYRDGWKQGYYDNSTGACDEPPPVPPQKYWNAAYQCETGRAAIDQWYSGWQDGASAAVSAGNSHFHSVAASPTVGGGPAPAAYHEQVEEVPAPYPSTPIQQPMIPHSPPAVPAARVPAPPRYEQRVSAVMPVEPQVKPLPRYEYDEESDDSPEPVIAAELPFEATEASSPAAEELESGGAMGTLSDDANGE